MEHVLRAPRDAVVADVFFKAGDFVDGRIPAFVSSCVVLASLTFSLALCCRWQSGGVVRCRKEEVIMI